MPGILVTGSEGLIGSALCHTLEVRGIETARLDLRPLSGAGVRGDIRDPVAVREAMRSCRGVVHLAAVSRVVAAQNDPDGCWQSNAVATGDIVAAALESPNRPWVLYASSREVYGEPTTLPVHDDAPLVPVNIYGRSKAEAERLVHGARSHGLNTAVMRFSNVYGRTDDHADRVVPAFARAAADGGIMSICGREHTFDFTFIDDVVDGVGRLIDVLDVGEETLPPIHFVSGEPTTLGGLAEIANKAGGGRAQIIDAKPRNYDVSKFYGDPARALDLLGWRARVFIEEGVSRLVTDFATLNRSTQKRGAA